MGNYNYTVLSIQGVYEMPLARCCILSLSPVSSSTMCRPTGHTSRASTWDSSRCLPRCPAARKRHCSTRTTHPPEAGELLSYSVPHSSRAGWEKTNLFSALVFIVVVLLYAVCQLAYYKDSIRYMTYSESHMLEHGMEGLSASLFLFFPFELSVQSLERDIIGIPY